MATEVKINDIASQLSTASRLVVDTDFFWIYMASGSQVKIPAEFVRAYLSSGLKPTIGENGNWYVGGVDTSVRAEAVAPKFRGGAIGIEVSYDKGETWETAVEYSDMNPDLEPLIEAYKKVTEGEEERISNENARKQSELDRQSAESKRESDFAASKKAADDATDKALSTYSHPPYVDADGYYYKWNVTTSSYDKTDVNLTGKAFTIKKVFASVAAMNATDVNTFDENDFILINTSNVEDADNAKLYVVALNESGKKFYSYLVDMSGFRGFTGKTPQIIIGTVATLAEDASATATLSSDGTDSNGNPKYKLSFGIPKGIRLRFSDLTDADKAELMKPATDAASRSDTQTSLCKTATDNANTATDKSKAQTDLCKTATDAANTATTKANNAASNAQSQTDACKTQTDLAQELNDNPLKQGDNGNWWKYNPTTKTYEDTGIAAIGGILYPSFYNRRNRLILVDYQQYVSNRVSYNRNRLKIKI